MQSASRCSRLPVCQVSIPQAVRIACNEKMSMLVRFFVVSIPQAVRIACNEEAVKQIRLRGFGFNTASGTDCMQSCSQTESHCNSRVSIPQAVRIACNLRSTNGGRGCNKFQYRKRYGLHAIHCSEWLSANADWRFNTASGTDCMQYCLPKPLETVNPKGGFLILPPCLRFSPNRREFFCRKRRLKRGAKPAIPRKLLSTKKT